MDNQQLKQFIQEVAEIKELTPTRTPTIRQSTDDEVSEVRIGDEFVNINMDSNPTLGFKFIRLKEVHRACDLGCGNAVANQVIEKKWFSYPRPHWRTSCKNCSAVVHPNGQELIHGTGSQVQVIFYKWVRDMTDK